MGKDIILASASWARAMMLRQANVDFTSKPARVDEDAIKQALLSEGAKPRDVADALAEIKAIRISAQYPDALVIGSDQVAEIDGQLLSKPQTMDAARDQLRKLRGQTHSLFSAAVIAQGGQPLWRHVGQVRLTMHDFSDQYLENYLIRTGQSALATVGSYQIESEGVRLFSRIEGDYFTILGMPLVPLLTYLGQIGAIDT